MEKKLRDPLGVLFGSMEVILTSSEQQKNIRAEALNVKAGKFEIDTCYTVDAGWETGIKPDGEVWIIVERYADKDQAKVGHDRWVKSLTDNPEQELRDVNFIYEDEEESCGR